MCLCFDLLTKVRKPMKVYKVLGKDLCSPLKHFNYEIGKPYRISHKDIFNSMRLLENEIDGVKYAEFNTGIYCFKAKEEALDYFDLGWNDLLIFEAVIPEGAYIAEQNNCIVTTDIIINPYYYVPCYHIPYHIFRRTFFIKKRYKR